ncbi:phage distal tail protein [Yinghuangia soli]|uniref:Phage tail family protein n=1 Tax=Yinghuangia soli TaxID=2908204 RepID=A0AA41Q546_9ACTN|nr:phage tail domain-containing protein [Yinghuangia soli]MCF2531754.1 phage tail family protein [Yinghuangia soli]
MAGELVTRAGLIEWAGLLFGGRPLPWRFRAIEGWEELPALDDASALRSGAHGADVGQLLAQPRIVTLDGVITSDQVGVDVAALNRATTVRDGEQPLVVWLDDRGPLLAHGRVVRRRVPTEREYALGISFGWAVQWVCSDPRRYDLAEQQAATGLPVPEPGLDWGTSPAGLDWTTGAGGLDWGAPGATGDILAVNSGNAPAHPTITITGPVQTPTLLDVVSGARLEYDLTLAVGDVLTVDTAAGSVLLGGADRLSSVTARSVPEQTFLFEPGETALAYRSADLTPTASTCTVTWRSAYW